MRNIISYADLVNDWIVDRRMEIDTCKSVKLYEHDNVMNFMYEPLSYRKLDKLFVRCPVHSGDGFIDFGCGKGRVLVMAAKYGCMNLYGIDISESLIQLAQKNLEQYKKKNSNIKFELLCMDAKRYQFNPCINWIFFYNPFQLKVFIYIFKALQQSLELSPRKLTICFVEARKSVIQYFEGIGKFRCILKSEKERLYIYTYDL